ncbi:MAG: serine/threonine protein kinase [Sandaracinaceae bacterium]
MFEVGDVVGSYTVLAHLRSGGMAELFLAYREGAAGFRRLVAVKVIHAEHAEDEHVLGMFLDEAKISARIDHPNVVHVEDLGELHETYFLVMEYVHGCSLAQLMQELGVKKRRLSPTVAVAIAARIAEGLHAAHETTDDAGKLVSLVHRDVSPQNILLSHKGHVKLIDFGVAKADLRSEHTNVAMLKGKVRYMPPEQATTGEVDRRSDVYSLGIVLWEMLTMRRLFAGRSEFEILLSVRDPQIVAPSEFVAEVSPELDQVILAALSKNPDERPQSAKDFRRMLVRAEPRSMALDSAHLADLVCSTMGDQLNQHRTELPQEVSRVLEAEQLRAAIAHAESQTLIEEPTESTIDVMTLKSDVISFDVEELDELSEDAPRGGFGDPAHDPLTRPDGGESMLGPGSDRTEQQTKSGRIRAPVSAVLSSEEAAALQLPTLDDADPTMVGDRPANIASLEPRYLDQEEESEELVTLPFQSSAPPEEPSQPPRLAPPAFRQTDPPPIMGATARVRPPRIPWIALILAVLVSAAFGMLLALLWPFGGDDEAQVQVIPGPAIEAPAVPMVLDAGPPDAGPPDAGPPPRRRRRARRRRPRR